MEETGEKITGLTELTEVALDDLFVTVDVSDTSMAESGTNKKVTPESLISSLEDLGLVVPTNGWTPAGETWTYASVDDPTGVIKVNADVTGKYSEGMRFKMTNAGNTIHAIVTKMGAYGGDEAGYTYITFLHEIDPSENQALHLLQNSAITNPYYSTQKAPQGFPLDPRKWSVELIDTTIRTQTNPSNNVWYNLGSLSLTIPIGSWTISYSVTGYVNAGAAVTTQNIQTTLSTTNNSETDAKWTTYLWTKVASSDIGIMGLMSRTRHLYLTTKTPYYLNASKPGGTASQSINFYNTLSPCIIRATCAYL